MNQFVYYIGYSLFAFGITMLGISSFLSYNDNRFEVLVLVAVIFLLVGFFFILTSKEPESNDKSFSIIDELDTFRHKNK